MKYYPILLVILLSGCAATADPIPVPTPTPITSISAADWNILLINTNNMDINLTNVVEGP